MEKETTIGAIQTIAYNESLSFEHRVDVIKAIIENEQRECKLHGKYMRVCKPCLKRFGNFK